ncbi:MAG: hypothetical protein ACREDR_04140, partial [Blastocatellia bacterium]
IILGLALLFGSILFGNRTVEPKVNQVIPAESSGELAEQATPEDEPAEAEDFFRLKRARDGVGQVPIRRYLRANERARLMPQHSIATETMIPSQEEVRTRGLEEPTSLGTWTQLGPGNIGGRTRAILIDPSTPETMYAAGVAGGVWKTTNRGASWTPVADLLANIAVCSMAMDPSNSNILYAGTGEGNFNIDEVQGLGIFKTTDGGGRWSQLQATNNPNFNFVNTIVVSPNNSQQVYAGTSTGIWRSSDGGGTWSQAFNPGLKGGCFQLVIRTDQPNDYILAALGTAIGTATKAEVCLNTDAGGSGTWTPVLTDRGMGLTSLAIAPSDQKIIYACASDNGIDSQTYRHGLDAVFRSINGGVSWTAQVRNTDTTKLNTLLLTNPIEALLVECSIGKSEVFLNQGWYDNVIAVDPLNPDQVWVGGVDLFRSDDAGVTWGLASYWWSSASAHADQHAIVFHPRYNGTTNQIMLVGGDGGLYETTNARAAIAAGPSAACDAANTSVTWTNLNNNYGVTQFYYGAVYPDGLTYFGGAQDNGISRGTDSGGVNAWSKIHGGDGGSVSVDPANTDVLYAETSFLSILKSTDGGRTFMAATSGISDPGFLFIAPFIMDPSNSLTLWTGGNVLWRTTDGAASWTQASATLPDTGVSAIAVAPAASNNAIAGLSKGFILRTNNALTSSSATSWGSSRPRRGYVAGLTFDPSNPNVAYAVYSTFNFNPGDNHVYRSTDAGATWTGIDGTGVNGLPDVPVHAIAVNPDNSSYLYVGTDIGVFVTVDGGVNWARENTGFANVITESLFVNTVRGVSTLFAFTHGRGAWRVAIPASGQPLTPTITNVTAMKKDLLVTGGQFALGATIILNGVSQKTVNDSDLPDTLIGKKLVKLIPVGQTVIIQVQNPNGAISAKYPYTRTQ